MALYVNSTNAFKLDITNTHKEKHINVRKWSFCINMMEYLAGDSLTYSDKMKFSTLDQDNDENSLSSSTYWKTAGWFKHCAYANPNGQYTDSEKKSAEYIYWYRWKNSYIAMKNKHLMIRTQAWQCVKVLTFYIVYLHTVFNVKPADWSCVNLFCILTEFFFFYILVKPPFFGG